MSGSNPTTHINRQYGVMDAIIYNNELSHTKYWYDGFKTERNKHKEYKNLLPQNADVVYGGQPTIFEIPIYADKLAGTTLHWKQGTLTTTGGTYRRFQDWLGLAAIKKIVYKFGPNDVYEHWPQKKFYKVLRHLHTEAQAVEAELLQGALDVGTRNAKAQAPQEILYDIPWPFTLSPDRYQEIRQLAIPPRIEVYWNELSAFVQTDGTNPISTITDLYITQKNIFLEPEERDANTLAVESEHGIIRLGEEHALETSTPAYKIPAGTTGEWNYELKNFKTTLRFLAFWMRNVTDITTPLARKDYELDSYFGFNPAPGAPDWKRFRIVTGAGEVIVDWIYKKQNLYKMHQDYYNSLPGIPIPFISWDDNPMDECNAHGGYNFQALQNPMLVIDFGSVPTAVDMYITLMSSKWNMYQTVRGEHAKQFS